MMPTIAALITAALGAGLLLLYIAFQPKPVKDATRPKSMLGRKTNGLLGAWSSRKWMIFAASVVGGIVAWYATGWIVCLVAVPLAAFGLPALVGKSGATADIKKLEALATWTHSLSGLITTGAILEHVLQVSLRNAPEEIKPQVSNLVSRLNYRWSPPAALKAFADELNDATADIVVAHLLLAYKIRGGGLADALDDLASIINDEVRHRREIETDREKPRTTAKLVTLITAVSLTFMALFAGQFLAAYKEPLGQLLLTVYLAGYVMILIWMRQMTMGKPAPRFLTDTGRAS